MQESRYFALVDVEDESPLVIHETDDEQAARDALTVFIAELRKKGRPFPPK